MTVAPPPALSVGRVSTPRLLVSSVDQAGAQLTARAEARRVSALQVLPHEQQGELGQFFTPERAADLIASLPRLRERGRLRVLDPGAGTGSLSAALVARIMRDCPGVELEVVALELDEHVAPFLQATLDDLVDTAAQVGVHVTTRLLVGDFIKLSTGLWLDPPLGEPFDLVIMNPPYRKLALKSEYRQAALSEGVDCSNLYAAFLALAANNLTRGGQLVAITPRSFANGPYFGQFRRFLLERIALDRIHVFESRSTVFADTGVLQENIIFAATRQGTEDKVVVSVSQGHTDELVERVVSYSDVVRPGDPHGFIRILAADTDAAVAEAMSVQPAQLSDLGVQVSTGKVVDFRARDQLLPLPAAGTVPLIYPGNLRSGIVEWPRDIRKDQAFAVRSEADGRKYLVPEGYYVVVKRFSAKEERRRVVAAVWDPTLQGGVIAFENHLNIFHLQGAGLSRDLAVGLSYWLNSSLVDAYFRTFSGHTQVNATDLRSLRFPTREALTVLGGSQDLRLPNQTAIDVAVTAVLDLSDGSAA